MGLVNILTLSLKWTCSFDNHINTCNKNSKFKRACGKHTHGGPLTPKLLRATQNQSRSIRIIILVGQIWLCVKCLSFAEKMRKTPQKTLVFENFRVEWSLAKFVHVPAQPEIFRVFCVQVRESRNPKDAETFRTLIVTVHLLQSHCTRVLQHN